MTSERPIVIIFYWNGLLSNLTERMEELYFYLVIHEITFSDVLIVYLFNIDVIFVVGRLRLFIHIYDCK